MKGTIKAVAETIYVCTVTGAAILWLGSVAKAIVCSNIKSEKI